MLVTRFNAQHRTVNEPFGSSKTPLPRACEKEEYAWREANTSPNSTGKSPNSKKGAAKSGAVRSPSAQTDPDLTHIIAAWTQLPDTAKRMILASIEAVVSGKDES